MQLDSIAYSQSCLLGWWVPPPPSFGFQSELLSVSGARSGPSPYAYGGYPEGENDLYDHICDSFPDNMCKFRYRTTLIRIRCCNWHLKCLCPVKHSEAFVDLLVSTNIQIYVVVCQDISVLQKERKCIVWNRQKRLRKWQKKPPGYLKNVLVKKKIFYPLPNIS